jgi:hypothetical protein
VWAELEHHAIDFHVSLKDYGILPPDIIVAQLPLLDTFDPVEAGREADERWQQLNDEQRAVATAIEATVAEPRCTRSRVFMLQASGGCGKSFVANYVAARVRSTRRPAICVAASAQAATVLTGGRTAHGQLKIPLQCDASSYLSLSVREKRELAAAAVLLWDEASMVSDVVADCVNRSFQDILQCALPFGGMPVIFIGDYRQLLPVIKQGRGEHHTLQVCSWWPEVVILQLKRNWRAHQADWLQLLEDVGMGRIDRVQVPVAAARQDLDEVIRHVWPDPSDVTVQKAVLTLTLECAAAVNSRIIGALPGLTVHAASIDEFVDCKEPDVYPEEFVRGLTMSGVAPGNLLLKVGALYIIMRNIDHRNGVVNGAQILCTALTPRHVIGAPMQQQPMRHPCCCRK